AEPGAERRGSAPRIDALGAGLARVRSGRAGSPDRQPRVELQPDPGPDAEAGHAAQRRNPRPRAAVRLLRTPLLPGHLRAGSTPGFAGLERRLGRVTVA